MNQELKTKWIEALRSGDWPQIRGHLGMPGKGHCCLGVLCEAAGVDKEQDNDIWLYDHCDTGLPDWLLESEGIEKEQQAQLINMNDGTGEEEGRNFVQIADWIEQNIPGDSTEGASL